MRGRLRGMLAITCGNLHIVLSGKCASLVIDFGSCLNKRVDEVLILADERVIQRFRISARSPGHEQADHVRASMTHGDCQRCVAAIVRNAGVNALIQKVTSRVDRVPVARCMEQGATLSVACAVTEIEQSLELGWIIGNDGIERWRILERVRKSGSIDPGQSKRYFSSPLFRKRSVFAKARWLGADDRAQQLRHRIFSYCTCGNHHACEHKERADYLHGRWCLG